MNSDKVRKEVGPAGSREFLYMVEGRSTESRPHADNVIQERCCVRVTQLLRSVGNRAWLLAHGHAGVSVLPSLPATQTGSDCIMFPADACDCLKIGLRLRTVFITGKTRQNPGFS